MPKRKPTRRESNPAPIVTPKADPAGVLTNVVRSLLYRISPDAFAYVETLVTDYEVDDQGAKDRGWYFVGRTSDRWIYHRIVF